LALAVLDEVELVMLQTFMVELQEILQVLLLRLQFQQLVVAVVEWLRK
jgi:hypothetical protein